jgi:hypothetical protein
MQHAIALAIAVAAVIVIFLAARAAGKNWRPPSRRLPAARASAEGELVAVIAAAVAAASGMETGAFRLVGVEASRSSIAQSSIAQRGFNTPPWGHVDRFIQGEGL